MGFRNLEPGQVKFSGVGSGHGASHSSGGSGWIAGAIAILIFGAFALHESCSSPRGSTSTGGNPPSYPTPSVPPGPEPVRLRPPGLSKFSTRFGLYTCIADPTRLGCLSAAPVKPGKIAAFSFNSSDAGAGGTAFVVAPDHLIVHVVPNELALPWEVRQNGRAVYPKTGAQAAGIGLGSVASLWLHVPMPYRKTLVSGIPSVPKSMFLAPLR